MRSDVIITTQAAAKMKKLVITSLFDLFNPTDKTGEYGSVTVKVSSPSEVDRVKKELEKRNLSTHAGSINSRR